MLACIAKRGDARSIAVARNSYRCLTSLEPKDATIHRRGDHPYGSREYLLMPAIASIPLDADDNRFVVAKLHAHRNIVFGAQVFPDGCTLLQVCPPLLQAALHDAGSDGEQCQAVSSLAGLSAYVRQCMKGEHHSPAWQALENATGADAVITREAVTAIATMQPRPGHKVLGQGTFRDGQESWMGLAREFTMLHDECQLYRQAGAQLVKIEHLADTRTDYLKSAGGAMARFFFI